MKYVGIGNSWVKNILLKSKKCRLAKRKTDDLAYDCRRHLELLREYEESGCISNALYVKVNEFYSNKSRDFLSGKMEKVIDLYKKIKERKDIKISVTVTENGIRLDGSHRVSILKFLGIKEIEVKEVYAPKFLLWMTGREAKKRRRAYESFKGMKAYTGNTLKGKVLYTDYIRKDPLSFFGDYFHILDTGEILKAEKCCLKK